MRADFLDHVDLVGAGVLQDDVEFGLLFGGRRHRHRRPGRPSSRRRQRRARCRIRPSGWFSVPGLREASDQRSLRPVFSDQPFSHPFLKMCSNGRACKPRGSHRVASGRLGRSSMVREDARDVRSRRANRPGDVRGRCADACPRSEAMSSSRDGIFATASTPAGSRAVASHCAAEDHELLVLLGDSRRRPWPQRRGLRNRPARSCPSGGRRSSRRRSFKGDLGEPVLGNANGPAGLAHLRAKVLHLGNRETCVVGNDHHARAFEDLAEFLDHFLFLGSIHSFTPSLEVLTLRLTSAGT